MNAAYEQRPELARQLKDLEHVADHTTHDIMRALNTSFITPFDREDIAVLAARMDDVVDHIEAAADLSPSDLAFFDPLWRDQERQQIFGDFLAGVRRGVESADRFDVPARARPANSSRSGRQGHQDCRRRQRERRRWCQSINRIEDRLRTPPASSMITRT